MFAACSESGVDFGFQAIVLGICNGQFLDYLDFSERSGLFRSKKLAK